MTGVQTCALPIYFNETSWTSKDIFVYYVRDVVLPHLDGRPGVLLLDSHSSHFSFPLEELSVEHNLRSICVPAGHTSTLQPFDVALAGPLKAKLRKEWSVAHADIRGDWGIGDAIKSLSSCLSELSGDQVRDSFVKAIGSYGDDISLPPPREVRRQVQRDREAEQVHSSRREKWIPLKLWNMRMGNKKTTIFLSLPFNKLKNLPHTFAFTSCNLEHGRKPFRSSFTSLRIDEW